MQKVELTVSARGRKIPATGWRTVKLTKTASYTVTVADIINAGGHLNILVTSAAAAVDITLPEASTVKGCQITLFKPVGNTNAVSFLATGGDIIEGSSANKRFENATNELGACTIWSNDADWRVVSAKGTWAVNNT